MKSSRRLTFFALFLVLFIDGMGQGILFPILNGVILKSSVLLSAATSLHTREIWYSVIIGVFFIFWFIGGPVISDFSDTIGRKKSLIICMLGTFAGYFLMVLALMYHSLFLLILGRIIDGFTAGAQSVAQAAVSDMTQENERERFMGLVLFAVTFGLIAGPLLGGFLSDSHIVSVFNYFTPLYFASVIALINFLLLILYYHDSSAPPRSEPINFFRAITVFKPVLKNIKFRRILTAFLPLQIGWTTFFVYISLYVGLQFHFSDVTTGVFFGVVGLGLSVGYLYLVKQFQSISISIRIMAAYIVTTLLMFFVAIISAGTSLWLVAFIMPLAIAVGYNGIFVVLANNASQDQQGTVMGVAGSIGMPLSSGISSFVIVNFSHINLRLPLYLAAILLAIGCVLLPRALKALPEKVTR